jgi:hypothetical protein
MIDEILRQSGFAPDEDPVKALVGAVTGKSNGAALEVATRTPAPQNRRGRVVHECPTHRTLSALAASGEGGRLRPSSRWREYDEFVLCKRWRLCYTQPRANAGSPFSSVAQR